MKIFHQRTRAHQPFDFTRSLWLGITACASWACAETETNVLATVVVEAARMGEVARSADGADFMQPPNLPELRLREQGRFASQVDMSVRGMPFSSAGVAVDGAAFRNPQTEHFNLGAELPAAWMETPRLLTGLERFTTTSGHAAGTLSYRLARMEETRGSVELSAGNRGMFGARMEGAAAAPWRDAQVATGAFAGYDTADQTDGYKSNDLKRYRAGARAGIYGSALEFEVLGAHEWRRFGAQGFYASPPALKSEELLKEWLNMASLRHTNLRGDVSQATLAWRRHRDVYWLDSERPWWYRNQTVSDQVVAHVDTRQTLSEHWAVALRADAEFERVDGRYRGTLASVPIGHHTRRRAEVAAVPEYARGDWRFSFGGGAVWRSDPTERVALLPALGVSWQVAQGQTLFANYTEAVRQPSFLELNYESPTSLGNRGLDDQHSRTFEMGHEAAARGAKVRVVAFADRTEDAVDWVAGSPGGRWVAENLKRVTTLGLAANGAVEVSETTEVLCGAAWLWKQSAEPLYASRYAMDYPVVDVRLGVRQRIGSRARCELAHNFWHQTRNRAREGNRAAHVLDISASYELAAATTLRVGLWNVLGEDFETHPQQPMLGRTAYVTLRQNF